MLSGIKVIELAGVLAGPAVGMFLAELGAEVIKVENPVTGGDITRKWKLPEEDIESDASAYFASANWGKQHLFIDIASAEGRDKIYELVRNADIIICNWKKGGAEKLKVDEHVIRQIKPDIIYAQLTGFGKADDRVAYDVVLQAETGWMFMNGNEGSGPLKFPVAIVDLFAAHQLKEGILTALIHKLKTGKGSTVTVSLFDAAVASLANQASNYLTAGHVSQRMGSLHPNIAPYGEILKFADGKDVVLAIGTDKQFAELCSILNSPHLFEDKRFATNKSRVENRTVLFQLLQSNAVSVEHADFLRACHQRKVPVGCIRNMKELFELSEAKKLILEDAFGKRVRTKIFNIE